MNKVKFNNKYINIIKGGGKGVFNFCVNCLWFLFSNI